MGFEVWGLGLGFGVGEVGVCVKGNGFGVQGTGFRVEGSWLRVQCKGGSGKRHQARGMGKRVKI